MSVSLLSQILCPRKFPLPSLGMQADTAAGPWAACVLNSFLGLLSVADGFMGWSFLIRPTTYILGFFWHFTCHNGPDEKLRMKFLNSPYSAPSSQLTLGEEAKWTWSSAVWLLYKGPRRSASTRHYVLSSSVVSFCLSLNTLNKTLESLQSEKETWLLRGKTNSLGSTDLHGIPWSDVLHSFVFSFCHFESSPRWNPADIPTNISTLGCRRKGVLRHSSL